jgi:hypothetical protein
VRLGSEVPNLLGDVWRFVAEDQHDIARRVQVIDPDARLAMNTSTQQLGIVRHIRVGPAVEAIGMDPQNTWIIAFKVREEDGTPCTGEPDARVLEQMQRFDTWTKRNPERARDVAEKVVRHREQQREKAERERARAMAESYIQWGRRRYGIHKNIYVPADIPRGQG